MLIKYFKDKREKRKANLKQNFELMGREAKKEIKDATVKMTSKQCPINDGNLCSIDCVHFLKGDIVQFLSIYDPEAIQVAKLPRCKLWQQ